MCCSCMSLGTPSTPASLSFAIMLPLVNFHRGLIQESFTTIHRGIEADPSRVDINLAAHTVVLHPCKASEMKRSLSRTTSFPRSSNATTTCFLPSLSQSMVSSNPIRDGGTHEIPIKICKNSSGYLLISIDTVERDPPLSKNVKTMQSPNIRREEAECLPSWVYRSSAVFPATSVYDCFTVLAVFHFFISPTMLTSLQSRGFFAASTGTSARSGFQLASNPFSGATAPCTTHVLRVCINVSWKNHRGMADCFTLNSPVTFSTTVKVSFKTFAIPVSSLLVDEACFQHLSEPLLVLCFPQTPTFCRSSRRRLILTGGWNEVVGRSFTDSWKSSWSGNRAESRCLLSERVSHQCRS